MEFSAVIASILPKSSPGLLLWPVAVNAFSFALFDIDKHLAKRRNCRRIPEKTLFLSAALGGSIGALLGMRVWRHKTLHRSFRIGIPLILFAQLALISWFSAGFLQ